MAIKLQGYVFKDDGTAVSGATVQAYDSADDSTEGSPVTTNSAGLWTYGDISTDGLYDIKISSGGSVRLRKGADKATFEELYIRNDTAATQSPLYLANATNATSVKVLDLSNKNSTRADNDEIYISFNLNDYGGNADEFARITAIATDVTNNNEDGALVFYVADSDNNGDLQEGFRITSSTGGTVSATTTSASQFNNTITVGVDDTGYDVKFFGATASAYMLWDEDVDDLILAGAARIVIPEGQLVLGSTAISSTSTELNLMDGGSSIGTTAVSDGHGIVMNHGGTMGQTTVQTLAAYLDDEITAMPNLVTVGTIGSGTWNGSAIASTYIAADAITSAKIADDAIGSEHIADDAVVSAAIADDAITSALIADDAITSALIADDAITSALIADDAITSALIADDAITTALIADDAITSALIADGAVTTALIGADAVTGAKIADDAIDSEHYTDGSIDNAHIADDAIDSEHYAAGSIDTAHIADNQVTLAKMAGLARGKIIYGDTSGDPAALAVGTANYLLTSDGTDTAWAAPAIRYIQCVVFDFATDIAEGNGKFYLHIPAGLNGMNLVEVHSEVITAGNGSTVDVQLHNVTHTADMLSTSLTINSTKHGSDEAGTTAAVINTSEDDVATNDLIRIDVDGNGGDTTIAKGLIVTLGFQLP